MANAQSPRMMNSADKAFSKPRAAIIGVYGIPGAGKSYLLNQLKEELGQDRFEYFEGSDMISTLVPGGLGTFQGLEEQFKTHWRQVAIDTIKTTCVASGKPGIVTGHFMFWDEGDDSGRSVHTINDLGTFTHILYLDIPPELVVQRRLGSPERNRPPASVQHLQRWQQAEKTELRSLCRQHGILFSLVSSTPAAVLDKVSTLLRDFQAQNEDVNLANAAGRLDKLLAKSGVQGPLETVVVFDADRTLAPADTGSLFWKVFANSEQRQTLEDADPLRTLFDSPMGYSYQAFRQATLLYEDATDSQEFDAICEEVASTVTIYPEIESLLRLLATQAHVFPVVITCGLQHLWEKVLAKHDLDKTVKVIGSGRIADGIVINGTVKAALVDRLRNAHHLYVWAFGDSVLDLAMLMKADQAVVVVGSKRSRSKTMDAALSHAIDGGLRAHQVLLPSEVSPRLTVAKLPVLELTDPSFTERILGRHSRDSSLRIFHATGRESAKLLMTPTRDATVAGPMLREAHRRVGWYLATEFVADVIGVEQYPILHVQGSQTIGYRLCGEEQTVIVALMRGGEPMALGVSDAFPLAMFVHAKEATDVQVRHLKEQRTVVLVDSVVNSGKTIIDFVKHVRDIDAALRIVVIAGVVQSQSVAEGDFAQALKIDANLHLVALRWSENKFTGKGSTDTGNRLFNTTQL